MEIQAILHYNETTSKQCIKTWRIKTSEKIREHKNSEMALSCYHQNLIAYHFHAWKRFIETKHQR